MNANMLVSRRQVAALSGTAVLAAMTAPSVVHRTNAREAAPTVTVSTSPEASPVAETVETRIRFSVHSTEVVVQVADSPTSRDFLSLLPLTLEFEDFASTEMLSYLPRELSTDGPTGGPFQNGDLIYFIPWGNIGFYYDADRRDPSYDDRVILIGAIETGKELLHTLGAGPVQVELIS